jgi:PKD repeat protein
VVAETSGGILQATPYVIYPFITPPCPKIDILTGFSQPLVCITEKPTARFQVVLEDPATSGIMKGTEWTIDWGDGTPITNFTSSVDYEIPPLALRQHTYTTVTSCNYVFSSSVRNPCGETRSVQYVAVVHGRDIPSDGNGVLRIVNNATGNPVVEVCEGTQTIVTLRDNSTWNCQSPVLPGGLLAVPNNGPRNIEWIYGRDPSGTPYNTINGTVTIVSLGTAPQASGRISPVPYGPNSLSNEIIIPASARAGEYFRVYLKNWNVCNWADPDFVSTYVDIEVVAAPPSPTAISRVVCIGEDKTLEVTSSPMGIITWYADAGLTKPLDTGTTFVPSETASGTYYYYVTDREASGLACQSAPTTVSLTISPKPSTPTIKYPNKNNICYGVEPPESYTIQASVSSTPPVTGFQWYRNGIPLPGRTYDTIYITKPWETGRYTVRAVGAAPSYCLGDSSTGRTVTVHTLLNVDPPEDQVICQNGTAIFHASTTMLIHQYQWEVSYNNGVSFTTVGNSAPYNGFNTETLTLTAPPVSFSGYLYRLEMMTPSGQGGCRFKSPAAMLTVDGLPAASAGNAIARCSPGALDPIYMTGATRSGSAASVIWTGGEAFGTWTQNTNPALAYFTPSVTSGSFTATLTVTGTQACGGVVVTRTRTISWSQTPSADAGPDIARCDANPMAAFTMTGAAAGGTYSGLAWTGGGAFGTWTQNSNPALAVFTPSVPSGSFTATLTVTGSGTCAGINATDTRIISWGQVPEVDAGGDISRCDVTPLAPIAMTGATATGTFTNAVWTGGGGSGSWVQNATNPALATFVPSVNSGSFTATLTITGAGACAGNNPSDTRFIAWDFAATVNAGPDQWICALSNIQLAGTMGGGATSVTWSGGTGTFSPNNTTLNAIYTPSQPEREAQTVTLTLTTNDPSGICPPVSDDITITIGTIPTWALLNTSGDGCFGDAQSWINLYINGGGEPYIIKYNVDGVSRPDITKYYNGTNRNIGILPTGAHTIQVTEIRDNCGNVLTGAGLPGPATIQIYQNPIAVAGPDQYFCGPLSASLSAVPSIGTGTWSLLSGPGTASFIPNANNAGATVTVSTPGSYVLRWTEINGGICVSSSDKAIYFERIANAGPDQDLCGTLAATLAGNAPAAGTGTWTRVSGPGTATFSPGANFPGATATVTAVGTYVFRWTLSNSGICSTSDEVTIVYNPAGQVNQPANLVVCNGSLTTPPAFTTVNTGGTTTYSWSRDAVDIGLPASGSGNLPAFTAVNTGTSPITATITATPTFTNGPAVCPGPPRTFTITVNPTGQVDQPESSVVCNGSPVEVLFNTVNEVGTTTFLWTNSNTAIGIGGNGSGDITFTATNNTTAPITGTIIVTPVFNFGGTGCPGPSKTFTITVNPTGQVNQPANQAICNGVTTTIPFSTANTNGTTSFYWTSNNPDIGLNDDGMGDITFTPINTGTTPVTATITVTPTFNNGSVDCPGPSRSFTITVNPTPTLLGSLAMPDICSNTPFSYAPASATAETTFRWDREVVTGITPAGPTTGFNNPNETLRNFTNIPIGVTYQYTLTANGCSNIQNVIVNVRPEPVIVPGQVADICSGNTTNYHINLSNFINPDDNVLFTWLAPVLDPVHPAFTGGSARNSASAVNIADIFTNIMGVPGTATYTVTPYKNGCAGAPETIVFTIRSQPVLDENLDKTVCSNTPIGLLLKEETGSVPIDYYNISKVTLDPGLSADPGNVKISNPKAPADYLLNDKYLNITGVDKNVTYTIQPFRAPDCYGTPVDVVITIRPQPYIVPAQIKTVCSGVPIGMEILLSPTNIPAGTLFNWPAPSLSDFSGQGSAGVDVEADRADRIHINDVIYNYSGDFITATYYITPTSAQGCEGTTIPVIITINPEPVPKPITGRDKVCAGEINLIYSVASASGSSFHWTVDPAVGTKTFDFNTSTIIINAALAAGAGNITVYETNSFGCAGDLFTKPVEVHAKPLPEVIVGEASVCANSTQVYGVTPRAGSVYSWTIPGNAAIIGDPSAASVTVVFGNVGGTIRVRETTIAGCVTDHTPLNVSVKPLPAAILSGGGTICEGSTGSLFVDFAGTGPYTFTYAINGVPQAPVNTEADPFTLNATLAGTYTIVNVTDATGCTNIGFGSAVISYYPRPTGIISGGATLCGGASSTVTFAFTGAPPFTFTYTDGVTPLTVPNWPNAVYILTVTPSASSSYTLLSLTDGNTCNGTVSGSAEIIVNPPPVLTLVGTNLTCNGDNTGAVNLTITGNGPFGIAWTGPMGFVANTEDLSGLAAGTYNVTVTDTRGCVSTRSVTLTQPGAVNATLASSNIFCFGSAEGTITISDPSGGSGSYQYTIDGGIDWVFTNTFTGLNPGTYDVRIRDVLAPVCDKILNAALVLTGPERLNATVTKTDVTCFGASNGSIIISNPVGGFGTYGYSINGGLNWQGSGSFTNRGPGTYNVMIRDAANETCVVSLPPVIVITEPPELTATVSSTNVTCFGASDGSITISGAAGGHGSYEYSINGGGSWQASGIYTGLTPGTYSVLIRDAGYTNCYKVLNGMLLITQPAVLRASVSSTMVTCFDAGDGTISITGVSGGSGSYQYTVTGGATWLPSGLFTGLTPGSYDVRIRDAANTDCEIILNSGLDITEPPALSGTVVKTDITCFDADDGRITITNSYGGYGTFEYTIDGVNWQPSNTFTGLTAGTYNVQMRDRVRTNCVLIFGDIVISEPAVLTGAVTRTNITCFNANDGTITISGVSGGSGSYQYTINGGVSWLGSGDFLYLPPGSYDVRMRDAVNPGCILILNTNLVITQPPQLAASASRTNVTCFGAANGTITITGTDGGSGVYEYTIDGGATWQASGSFSGLMPGFYNVRIRDAANPNCIFTVNGSLNITEPPVLNAVVAKTNITCFGANDGTITISSPTGGYGTYEFTITGGAPWMSTGSFTNLGPGTYIVRMRDAVQTGCVLTLNPSLVITEPPALAATLNYTDITCFGANNGAISITGASGGYGFYEYSIDGGSNWTGLSYFPNLPPATYNVRMRDAMSPGCVLILNSSLKLNEPPALSATLAKTDISCFGAGDGTITISDPAGGLGTYQFTINGGGSWQPTGSYTGLGPGNYNVQMRDAANPSCVLILNNSLSITQPSILNAVVLRTMVTCNGAGDGIIDITSPTGGYGNYQYSIDGGSNWSATGYFPGRAPGIYDVRIRDAANPLCVIILNNALMITEPAPLNAILNSTNVTCFEANDGTITISGVTGGYGTYEYTITGAGGWQSSSSFSNLSPGTYDVQIRDREHPACVKILNDALVITEPAALSASVASTNVTCFGAGNGTITITSPSGGYGTYGYSIDGGMSWQSTGTFSGLAPGPYSVRIRDAANSSCSVVLVPALVITQPDILSADVASTNITCYGASDGTITVSSPLGGYGTYEYSITGGAIWQDSGDFTDLAPGFYNVQIRDAANTGCVRILNSSLSITQPAMLNALVASTMVTCNGVNDGTINITSPTGGYGTYQYSINGTNWSDNGLFTGLSPSIYTVRIRDAVYTDCVIILNASLVITEPQALNAVISSNNVTCNGADDGSIYVSFPTGGYGTYEYRITPGGPWQTTGIFTGLAPDTYLVQIRDRAHPGCEATLDIARVITEPDPLDATVTVADVSCFGVNNGTITITGASGGYGTYAYSINGGSSWQASGVFTNLQPGNYDVRIRDAAYPSCEKILEPLVTIAQPEVLTAIVTSTNATCYDADDGTITVTSPLGGSGTYEYTVTGGIAWQGSGSFTDLAPGFYNVQIRDEANPGCIIILNGSLRITEPPILSAFVSRTNVTCYDSDDGTIAINGATGGYGTYGYSIDGGATFQTSSSFTGLAPGLYDVRINDAANPGCVIILNSALVITEPAVLSATVSATMVTCNGANDGTITIANSSGGSGFYQYSSDGGTNWQGMNVFTNLAPGIYEVRIRDASQTSCVMVLDPPVEITQQDPLSASIASTNVSCYGSADGTITISDPEGGYGTYEYSINGGGSWHSSGSFSSLSPGNYNILFRDASNIFCMKVLDNSYSITQPGMLTATVAKTDITCLGVNDGSITITSPAGGYGTYQFSIDGGLTWDDSDSFTDLPPGTYDVRMRDASYPLCRALIYPNLVIGEPALLTLTSPGDIVLGCFGNMSGTGTFFVSGGTLPYSFTVESNSTGGVFAAPGFNSLTFYAAGAGSITVRVTDSKGCTVTSSINITQPDQLTAGTIEKNQVICSGTTPAMITQETPPSGGPGAYAYQWQFATDAGGPFINITGANDVQYTFTAGATSTLYYRRMVTSGSCTPVYSNVVQVLVNPLPVAILSGNATICPGEEAILKVSLPAGVAPFEIEIANLGTLTDYYSEEDIMVSPDLETTYTLLRVRDANGCEVLSGSANLMGTAKVILKTLPAITINPVNRVTCEYGMITFSVTATGSDLAYQWYVDKNDGLGFTALTDAGIYYGANAATLNLFGTTRDMDGYVYRVIVSGCGETVTSGYAVLTVNTAPEIMIQPKDSVICSGEGAAFHISARGAGLTFRWQVNRGTGAGFVDVENDGINFSGAADSTLILTGVPANFNNYIFRVILRGTCGSAIYSNFVVLRVTPPPAVTRQPEDKAVCDGAGPVYFLVYGSGMIDSLRWQVKVGGEGAWTDIYDNAIYGGTSSQQLSMMGIPLAYNGNQYRLALKASCATVYTDSATLTVNSNPVVTFTPDPVNACADVPQTITPVISGGSGIWNQHTWTGDVGPLNNYFAQEPVFRTMIPGTYNLNYRVRDDKGCYGNGNVTVLVDRPDASFDMDMSYMCDPGTVRFTKDDMTGIASWIWDFGDGETNTTDANPEHVFTNSNPSAIEYYNVRLTVESTGGCTASYSQLVTVYPSIDATFTADKLEVCSGEVLTFTAIPGAANYSWDFGDGVGTPGRNVVTHLYTNLTAGPLVRTVRLTTTSYYNCTDEKTLEITVMPVPAPQFTAAPTPQIFNPAGNTVTFTNETPNQGSFTYTWTFGDGNTSSDISPVYTYMSGLGTYNVTLTATNGTCTKSIMHQVTILPEPPVASFDSIPSGCAPLAVEINNTTLNADTPGTTYRWDFGDGSFSTAKNPTYTYFTPGIYRVELTVTGPGGVSAVSQVVHAYPSPKAYFEVTPNFVFVNDERVRCFNLSQGANSYMWDFGDGNTSNEKEPFHRYMEEGVYDITLWAYSDNGCTDQFILSPAVTVEPAGELRFASIFMPNKEGPIERTDLPTGGTEIDQFFFPAIREKVLEYKLQIFNRWGVLIFETKSMTTPWNGYYKGELCPQGVYVWYVEGKFANGEPFRKVGDVTLLH